MSQFVKKASSKIEKLSYEEIRRIINAQNSELKIRNSILDNSIEGYLLISNEGKTIYLNSSLQNLIPLSTKKSYTDIIYSKVVFNSEINKFISSFLKSARVQQEDFFDLEHSLSGPISISCSAFKLKDLDACLFVFRDVTFFKKFKEEFRKNESLAQLTTMAAGVAHEIKNPLASISIYLQLLEKIMDKNGSITKEDAKKYLDIVQQEVDRINSIAVDFLFAVKPMKVDLKSCYINDIVNKTLNVVTEELKSKNIKLIKHLASSLPKVFADNSLIEQSLLNLIKNSMQAIDETKEGKITLSTYLEDNMVKISVLDNGCGMTEEQMSKIFEPYYTTKSSGTGLGLTVLYKIMKQHGGDVTVKSTYGSGSEFILQIPIPNNERYKLDYSDGAFQA